MDKWSIEFIKAKLAVIKSLSIMDAGDYIKLKNEKDRLINSCIDEIIELLYTK